MKPNRNSILARLFAAVASAVITLAMFSAIVAITAPATETTTVHLASAPVAK